MDIVKTETHCEPNLIGRSLTKGLSAAKEYRVAGTVLWLFGCVLVFGYYFVPTLHHTLEQLGNLKRQSDFVFASVSTGLFGGFLPSLIIKLASKSSSTRHYLFSNSLFWAIKGAEIEILYQLQARAFGDQADWSVVALKTCFDQFIYVPTIGIVNVVLFYVWRESRYNCAVFRKRLGSQWYLRRVLPVIVSNWVIWIPAVVLIYCFPLALQLPVQNLILCFWVLMLAILTRSEDKEDQQSYS